MLKNGGNVLLAALKKLFNYILNAGQFPNCWNESFLVLIHKTGNKFDPSNYRGISITSNLGKLFNKVIHERLLKFIFDKNLISEYQIGFKEKCRTSDHLFTLKTIIDHYKKDKKKVFAAFIDLKKAFDTIWRTGLFYKLLKAGVSKKMFNIISSMYKDTNARLKFSNGLSETFPSECGVKQGDVLSPTLFNIFIDGIVSDLRSERNCEPVVINGMSINCLLYADDIILLSDSKEGLQSSIDVFKNYCKNWNLQVNVNKSKVMVFNSNGKSYVNNFKYDDCYLETVSQYCYLGVMLKHNGNFNVAISVLMEKARKALFKIKKILGINNPCRLLEKLFDTLVTPILLYNCEIWGSDIKQDDSSAVERFYIKFIKEILGVNCKTSNSACRAELGKLPLWSKISFSCIKYYNHLLSNNETLAHKIFVATKSSNPWTKKINNFLNKLGFSYVVNANDPIKHILGSIKQRIEDQASQLQQSSILNSSKLCFFRNNCNGQRPPYVDLLSNKSDRANISRLRLCSHNLAIETGRHHSIPVENRKCTSCDNGSIEDEEHFVLQCENYKGLRLNFENSINNIFQNTKWKNSPSFLKSCFYSKSFRVLKLLSSFIGQCFLNRK